MIIIQQQNKTVALMCSYLQLTNDGFHQGVTKERTLVPAWTNQKGFGLLVDSLKILRLKLLPTYAV